MEETSPQRSLPVRFLRWCVTWGTYGYTLALLVALLGMRLLGERNPVANLGLFAPPVALLLPVVLLLPFALFLRPRLVLVLLFGVGLVLVPFMGLRWRMGEATGKADLVCVTNNVAQGHKTSVVPFVRQVGADVLAMQDSYPEGQRAIAALSDWKNASEDQFVLLSRYPITRHSPILLPPEPKPVAARFEVQLPARKIAIYNVRLPTPRKDLLHAWNWLGDVRKDPAEIQDAEPWKEYTASLPKRLMLIEELKAVLKREKLPYLVLGDFNTPSTGRNYRALTGGLTDSFARTGRGYGLSFPGDRPYWFSLRQPWLRLDYIFAGPGWEPLTSEVEQKRVSEHRAVAASFRFVGDARE